MTIDIGTAPDSWGVWFPSDPKQIPWQRFLDEVVEAGYEAIELGPLGYLPRDGPTLRQALQSRNLKVSGGFIFQDLADPEAWARIQDELEAVTNLMLDVGAKYLVVINTLYTDLFSGEKVGPALLEQAAWQQMVGTIQRIGEHAAAQDLAAVYHPHAQTPVESMDQIERLLADTDPGLVSLCLDLGHVAYGDGDPLDLIDRYPDRIEYLHLKNVDGAKRDRARAHGLSFAEAVKVGTFCDLADGVIDYVDVRTTLERAGFAGWGIVEQDMYPCEFDRPLPSAKRNREYLRQIGFG